MRLRLPVWLAAAAVAVAQEQRERTLPATLTPGDGVLLFSPASVSPVWTLLNTSLTSNTSLTTSNSNSSPLASSPLLASTNTTNATASFAFFGTSFSIVGSGAGELQVSVVGFAESEHDPRRAPDWDGPHRPDANVTVPANRTREISSQRLNITSGVLYADNSTTAEWKNVTVQLVSGSVAIKEVQINHRVQVSANRADEAPVLTLPAVWWANGSLNGGGELQYHGAWGAKKLTADVDTEPRYAAALAGAGSVSLRTPANASFVRLNGHFDDQCAPYDVSVTATGSQVPNARYRPLCTGRDGVLFEAALDPTLEYNVVLRSAAADGQVLGFTSAQFVSSTLDLPKFSANATGSEDAAAVASSHSSGKRRAGAIAGGVIGGLVGLALIAALLWYCCRRRPMSRRSSFAETEEGHEKPMKHHVPYNDEPSPGVPEVGLVPWPAGFWSRISRKPTLAERRGKGRRGRLSSVPPQLSPIKTGTVSQLRGIASLGASVASAPMEAVECVRASPYPDHGAEHASSKRSIFSNTSWSLVSLGSFGRKDALSVRDPRENRASKQTAMTHLSWSTWDVLDMAPGSARRAGFSKFSNSSWSFVHPPTAEQQGAGGAVSVRSGSVMSALPSPRRPHSPGRPGTPGTPGTPDSPVPPPPPLSPLPSFDPPKFDAYASRSESEISTLPKNSFEASRSTFARTSMDSGQAPALTMLRRDDTGRQSAASSSFSNLSSFNISRTSFKINPLRMPVTAQSTLERAKSPRSPTSPKPPQGPRPPGSGGLMRSVSSRIALAGFSRSKMYPDARLSEENGNTLERLEKEIRRASQQ